MNKETMSQLVQDVIDGLEDPIKAFAILKQELEFTDQCLNQVKTLAVEQAAGYEKVFDLHGFRFEQRSGGKYYDFSPIPEWIEQKNKLSDIEQKYKAAYSNYEKGQRSISEDGEVLDLPVVKNRPDVLILKK